MLGRQRWVALTVLALLVLSTLLDSSVIVPKVRAASTIGPSAIGVGFISGAAGEYSPQRKMAYANGRTWILFTSTNGTFYQTSSSDGTTWLAPTQVSRALVYTGSGAADITDEGNRASFAYNNVDRVIYWVQGKLDANGTVTLDAIIEQVAVPAGPSDIVPWRPNLLYDSNNHAWITYARINTTSQTEEQMVTENQNTDGTWSTAPGFPKALATGVPIDNAVDIVKLAGGRMYFIRSDGSRTVGNLWNGSAMEPDEPILAHDPEMLYTSTSSYGDDVYFASCLDPDGPQFGMCIDADARIQLQIRFYGNSSWGAPVVASVSTGIYTDAPTISVVQQGIYAGDAVVFWIPTALGELKMTNRYVMYSRYSRSSNTFQAIPTTWIDDVSGLVITDGMQSYYSFNGDQTGVFWTKYMGGGLYQGRIAFLDVTGNTTTTVVPTTSIVTTGTETTSTEAKSTTYTSTTVVLTTFTVTTGTVTTSTVAMSTATTSWTSTTVMRTVTANSTSTTTSSVISSTTSSSTASAASGTGRLNVNLKLMTYKTANVLIQVCTDVNCAHVVASTSATLSPSVRTATRTFVLSVPPNTYYVQISGLNIVTQRGSVTFGTSPQTVTFTTS